MKLVSCILPTRGRREWAAQALKCYTSQTYPNKELLIVDDDADPSFEGHVSMTEARIRHIFSSSRSIPEKRNIACGLADGEIIAHIDSDDWSDANRLDDQVKRLEESNRAVTGYNAMLFYAEHLPEEGRYFRYVGSQTYAVGTSLMYTKAWWQKHKFPEVKPIGEDNVFVNSARQAGQIVVTDAGKMMVARIHPDNTATKYLQGYRKANREDFPEGFFR